MTTKILKHYYWNYVCSPDQVINEAAPSEGVRHGGGRRTKNLQGEREKRKRREERKRKEEKEKREEKRKEMATRAREKDVGLLRLYIGVKHPLRIVKRLLKKQKEGG